MYNLPQFNNLVDMAVQQASQRNAAPLATFLKDNGAQDDAASYQSLHEAACAIAMTLQEKGLSGRNMLLLFAPGIDYIRAFFGCLYAGCVPVPAYPPMGARDLDRLQKVAKDCDAGAIVTNQALAPVIEHWVQQLGYGDRMPCLALDQLLNQPLDSGFQPYQAQADEVAFLQYTSGSTGHPKGVEVTHGNLLANFNQILHGFFAGNERLDKLEDLRVVIWLPPFHDMGLIGGVLTPIFAGAQVTLMSPLTFLKRPLLWLQTLSDQKAHVSGGPNFGYQYCVRKISEEQAATLDLSNWHVAFNGAEPIQSAALDAFSERFRVSGFDAKAFLPCYGLAEASLFVAGSPSGRGAQTLKAKLDRLEQGHYEAALEQAAAATTTDLVSSGVVARGSEIKIVHPRECRECQPGEVGEIWIHSPSVARGYWNKPQFSVSVFNATIEGDDSGRHYLRSGDLGFLLDDELYVTGRIKEVIILAGRNHYPQDIERTLQSANPTFRTGGGAAFAVTIDGKEELVVLQEVSRAAADQTDYRALAAVGVKAISSRHGVTPAELVLLSGSSIPKTSSGKIQRADAKRLYQEGKLVPAHLWQAASKTKAVQAGPAFDSAADHLDFYDQLYGDLQQWVADKLDIDPHHIDLDVTFSELGVDSVEAVELVDRLQDRIGRVIPAIELLRYPTVQALIQHFADELEEQALQSAKTVDLEIES
ncbi:MAG: AMP-binding protein [Pseudomonadota bacterium]|jgi:acyl-CoA synthetase (AMP-forming)/AMP-acid ligase II/acyl carrier protein|nr:AMP-binding protein [Pseudomonadota bacterium]|tara:strand:+ start:46205 stop:48313 length:2109 start_codon:yes stop_codon:yes gene_type:complete